jgi:alpha-tubulin suppressor-like RCC1 family protein
VFVDDAGEVWTVGSNKYGQLGRDIDELEAGPRKIGTVIVGGEEEVRVRMLWQTVNSGWSHTVVKGRTEGTRRNRQMVYAWGRSDMGQLALGPRPPKYLSRPVKLVVRETIL